MLNLTLITIPYAITKEKYFNNFIKFINKLNAMGLKPCFMII